MGSAPYLLTLALKARGHRLTGVDLDPSRFAALIAAHDLDILDCNIEEKPLPLAGDSVDLVLFNELFEHLRIDPIFTLGEVLRVLKPGGRLFLSTPNLKSLTGIRNFLFAGEAWSCSQSVYDQYAKLKTIGHMGHVREYTAAEVTDFLSRVGFSVERQIYRGRYASNWEQMAARMRPQLRPFVTYIAGKPAAAA